MQEYWCCIVWLNLLVVVVDGKCVLQVVDQSLPPSAVQVDHLDVYTVSKEEHRLCGICACVCVQKERCHKPSREK